MVGAGAWRAGAATPLWSRTLKSSESLGKVSLGWAAKTSTRAACDPSESARGPQWGAL